MPAPHRPLVSYFGVLSSASQWRSRVVPQLPEGRARSGRRRRPLCAPQCAQLPPDAAQQAVPRRDTTASAPAAEPDARQPTEPQQPAAIREVTQREPSGTSPDVPPCAPRSRGCIAAATRYIPWADLLRRVYDRRTQCTPYRRGDSAGTDHAPVPPPVWATDRGRTSAGSVGRAQGLLSRSSGISGFDSGSLDQRGARRLFPRCFSRAFLFSRERPD